MDLARRDPRYVRELAAHHVGGHLKVAPEHTDPTTLELMKKPGVEDFDVFARQFKAASRGGGQAEAVPRPLLHREPSRLDGGGDDRSGALPEAQRLSPAPGAGLHPGAHGHRDVHVLHGPRSHDHAARRRRARDHATGRCSGRSCSSSSRRTTSRPAGRCSSAGRGDLIGDGCDALIPATPPREAIEARRGGRAHSSTRPRPAPTSTRAATTTHPRRRRPSAIAPAAQRPAAGPKHPGTGSSV